MRTRAVFSTLLNELGMAQDMCKNEIDIAEVVATTLRSEIINIGLSKNNMAVARER